MTGSTALGERLDPEATRRLMRRYYDAMSAAVERHGGKVEKFIGDAVMAVFGISTLHEDDALRAVRAAADMRRDLAALNEELERDFGVRIEARTGVNTGEVVAGGWPRTRRLSSTSVSPARAATPRRRSRTRRGSFSNASRANGRWSSSWTTCIGRSRPSSTWWST